MGQKGVFVGTKKTVRRNCKRSGGSQAVIKLSCKGLKVSKKLQRLIDFLKKKYPKGVVGFDDRDVDSVELKPVYVDGDVIVEYAIDFDCVWITGITYKELDYLIGQGILTNDLELGDEN